MGINIYEKPKVNESNRYFTVVSWFKDEVYRIHGIKISDYDGLDKSDMMIYHRVRKEIGMKEIREVIWDYLGSDKSYWSYDRESHPTIREALSKDSIQRYNDNK